MKIALLHGAFINAGDFLIKEQSKKLLKLFYPDCIINEYYRNTSSLSPIINEINDNDILILAGGPGYINSFYPKLVPLVDNLNDIKIPIMMLGMGWNGIDVLPYSLYTYIFNESQRTLYSRVISDTKLLGCRDYHTINVLRNNGIDATLMTGCPAWYNMGHINQIQYSGPNFTNIKNICISDCAHKTNLPLLIELIKYIRFSFPNTNIKLILHRIKPEQYSDPQSYYNTTLLPILNEYNILPVDISYSADGFKNYDDSDLHIGFRVHAHIYNLSIRHASILIEEDSRGNGINSYLGLDSIKTKIFTMPDTSSNNARYESNSLINCQIEDTIFKLHANNYKQLNNAYQIMSDTFSNMSYHIKSIKNYI